MDNSSNSENVRTTKSLVSEPLARLDVGVGIPDRLVRDLDLHFVNFYSAGSVVRDVELAAKRRELFKLKFVNHDALLVG